MRNLMILTIQRLDSTVDFSVILVCKIAMIDSPKMTCIRKKMLDKRSLLYARKCNKAYIRLHFLVVKRQFGSLPFPMIRWSCTRSISAGMRTSFTSSSSSGLKLEMEILSGGMRGLRAGSTLPVA